MCNLRSGVSNGPISYELDGTRRFSTESLFDIPCAMPDANYFDMELIGLDRRPESCRTPEPE